MLRLGLSLFTQTSEGEFVKNVSEHLLLLNEATRVRIHGGENLYRNTFARFSFGSSHSGHIINWIEWLILNQNEQHYQNIRNHWRIHDWTLLSAGCDWCFNVHPWFESSYNWFWQSSTFVRRWLLRGSGRRHRLPWLVNKPYRQDAPRVLLTRREWSDQNVWNVWSLP